MNETAFAAASSICFILIVSLLAGDIDYLCFSKDYIAEIAAEAGRGVKIDASVEQRGKFILQVAKGKAGSTPRFEFHQQIQIAV